ncbi:MAG: hypothetical protein MR469_01705 [Campylobacter sp.]|uniref:hypothetical protein n=2 Tax=Campylobacter sp. TaxID=205 RepID=UPI002AA6EBBB|nr:hypothetical protein [Campylobacter sp.]MCI6694339.1 hypothetical protein [Campylobacter sp.]
MAKKLALIYLCIDAVLIAICAYFGAVYVLNSQVSLISSSLIILASFLGYKKRVAKKIANADISAFDDVNENSRIPSQDEVANLENSRIPNENEAKNARNSRISNEKTPKIPLRLYEFGSVLSPLRLLAYVLLILAFFILVKKELFEPLSFLAGIAVMPISALFSAVFIKAK